MCTGPAAMEPEERQIYMLIRFLVFVAVAATALVLAAGMWSLANRKDGVHGARKSVRLMRLRVLTQTVAVCLVLLFLLAGSGGW